MAAPGPRRDAPVVYRIRIPPHSSIFPLTYVLHSLYDFLADMGFADARRRLIEALQGGAYGFEPREALTEKNLLAVGEVNVAFVVRLLHRCQGADYHASPHELDPRILVHVFRPRLAGERWYVKAYFLSQMAVFISVHRSG